MTTVNMCPFRRCHVVVRLFWIINIAYLYSWELREEEYKSSWYEISLEKQSIPRSNHKKISWETFELVDEKVIAHLNGVLISASLLDVCFRMDVFYWWRHPFQLTRIQKKTFGFSKFQARSWLLPPPQPWWSHECVVIGQTLFSRPPKHQSY